MLEFYDSFGRVVEDTGLVNLRRHIARGGTLFEWIQSEMPETVTLMPGDFIYLPGTPDATLTTHIHPDGRKETLVHIST